MKRAFLYIIAAVSLLTTSCELEHSGNGKLDGMWHIMQIENLTTTEVQDLSQVRLYWEFQGKLMQVEDRDYQYERCLLRFEHSGNTLRVYDPYRYDRENGDEPLTEPTLLLPYGISQIEETFEVEHLGDKHFVLKSPTLRIRLKRF